MGNSYAPGLSPAVGNGLPGMPVRKNGSGVQPKTILLYSGSDDFKIPAGYSFVRITAVGAGGGGAGASSYSAGGGGGGGLAMSAWMPCSQGQVISYQIGVGGASIAKGVSQDGNAGGDTVVTFNGIRLVGGGGKGGIRYLNDGITRYSDGGIGAGGLVNYNGGKGGPYATGASSSTPPGAGGGAAGTGSNGNDGLTFTKTYPNVYIGPDSGGQSGYYANYSTTSISTGGGGSGAMSGTAYYFRTDANPQVNMNNLLIDNYGVIGFPSKDSIYNGYTNAEVGDGGLGGGGGAGASSSWKSGKGGDGAVRIELY